MANEFMAEKFETPTKEGSVEELCLNMLMIFRKDDKRNNNDKLIEAKTEIDIFLRETVINFFEWAEVILKNDLSNSVLEYHEYINEKIVQSITSEQLFELFINPNKIKNPDGK